MIADQTANLQQFLRILYDPGDFAELRLIETWTEDDLKRSEVVKQVVYRAETIPSKLDGIGMAATAGRANVFIGVCPRVGPDPKYGKAGYVATVRTLWADLDHVTVEVALERVKAAGLPEPSAVVCSGNGVHLYWRLTTALTIPLTYTFTVDRRGNHIPDVSDFGRHVESVIAGIGSRIGGDHTQDLSRVLRLPGTPNLKNYRNGAKPTLCELVSVNAGAVYDFDSFEPFKLADANVTATTRTTADVNGSEAVELDLDGDDEGGVPWCALTERQQAALESLIETSASSADRSQADFSLCAFAYKLEVDPAELWGRVLDVGKFGERGEGYFVRTWKRAKTRVDRDRADRAAWFTHDFF